MVSNRLRWHGKFSSSPCSSSRPRRVVRETWALGPSLYLVNAREDPVDNVCRAIAESFRALAPEIVTPR